MEEDFRHDTARSIEEPQCNYMPEVSCGSEDDLHRQYAECQKNPGHSQFIPTEDLTMEHLPAGCRDKLIVDWIRAEADLTCRLTVRCTSDTDSDSGSKLPSSQQNPCPFYQDGGDGFSRAGSGWVGDVKLYTKEDNINCECDECSRPGTRTPRKVWGKVCIYTAYHVVSNSYEARHTTCHFGYDTSKTHISQCPSLKGHKVEDSNIMEDWCWMTCVSHDMVMIDMLYILFLCRKNLWYEVMHKYLLTKDKDDSLSVPATLCVTDPAPVVIISHPHGCSKKVTVGMWTHRKTWGKTKKYRMDNDGVEWQAETVATSYRYNTATCPGSSGAPVIKLPEKGKWWLWVCFHPHSKGCQGNDNCSGLKKEIIVPFHPWGTRVVQVGSGSHTASSTKSAQTSLWCGPGRVNWDLARKRGWVVLKRHETFLRMETGS